MNKKFYWFFFCVLVFTQIVFGQTQSNDAESKSQTKTEKEQRDFPKLKKQAEELRDATLKSDYDKLVDYVLPKLIEMSGGKDKWIGLAKQQFQRIKSNGSEIISVEFGEAKQIENVENQLFALIPTKITIKSPKGRILGEGSIIGISNDNGENWKFIDTTSPDGFKTLFPKAAEKIRIPAMKTTMADSAFAQTEGGAKWQIIAPPAEEFSVALPVSPESANFDESDTSQDNSRRYTAESGGTYFFIFSDPANKPVQGKTVLDFAGRFQAGASLPSSDFQSKKFAFHGADGFYHTILAVKTPTRVYIFQTASDYQSNPQVDKFFASIKFNQKISSSENKSPTKTKNKKTGDKYGSPNAVFTISSSQGAGIGRGNGRGSGAGDGTTPKISPTVNIQTSPLKLLSKPSASYTDLARFYRIVGRVRLRITFLANGMVGSVSPVSGGLPFGLTQQAVEAAQAIKFEPAKVDGQPVMVVKQIEYSFTIF